MRCLDTGANRGSFFHCQLRALRPSQRRCRNECFLPDAPAKGTPRKRARHAAINGGNDSDPLQYPLQCFSLGLRECAKLPIQWSGRRDSNPRPSAPKADALPDCATPRLLLIVSHAFPAPALRALRKPSSLRARATAPPAPMPARSAATQTQQELRPPASPEMPSPSRCGRAAAPHGG